MSDFLGKIVRILPLFFCGKNFFFSEFSEIMSNFFFSEIDCNKLFFNEFSCCSKKFPKFFTVNIIEKKIRYFFGKFKKKINLPQKKWGHRVEIPTIFSGKSDMPFRWVFEIYFFCDYSSILQTFFRVT